jgi:hypothetical protein
MSRNIFVPAFSTPSFFSQFHPSDLAALRVEIVRQW